jgi:hypothetical protein
MYLGAIDMRPGNPIVAEVARIGVFPLFIDVHHLVLGEAIGARPQSVLFFTPRRSRRPPAPSQQARRAYMSRTIFIWLVAGWSGALAAILTVSLVLRWMW